ncbi:MAG: hypothetical protein LBQ63_07695 [Deltaproteobacteria bacterium]|jgi:homocitrate synthase NifV|nr:hypothetical protein [Deltaproteobacteria bacterium]
MRITDVTLACLRAAGRAAGAEEVDLWRGLLLAAGADRIEDGPASGGCIALYRASSLDFEPEELAAFADSGRRLRIFGLDDALSREDYRAFLARLRQSGLPLEPAFGNAFGCATALGLTWLEEGGEGLVCSFAGIGNLAPLEEILTALHIFGLRQSSGLHVLPRALALFSRLGGLERVSVGESKAVLGRLLFTVESGVHVDGLLKDAALYEPFAPELVGAERRLALGAYSGRSAVRLRCSLAGLPCAEGQEAELARAVRAQGRRCGRCLEDDEFFALYERVCGRRHADVAGA